MACHIPPLKSKETRGNAITQPLSHPINPLPDELFSVEVTFSLYMN